LSGWMVIMKKLLVLLLLAVGTMFAVDLSLGVRIGPPPRPRVIRVRPVSPGPNLVWVDGYWYPVGSHYRWHNGYYTRPHYEGALWVAPRHDGERYYAGYWNGPRGRYEHDHHWDHEHNRDYREDHH
jgi:hypothetical protein